MAGVEGDMPSGSEDDFRTLDSMPRTRVPAPVFDQVDIERAGFAPATEDRLHHVAPGCFVLVLTDSSYCWAEVTSVEGEQIGARLHNELSSSPCPSQQSTSGTVFFHRERIKALGCDRYCWC